MASENETVADIVADMRNESHAGDASCLEWVGAKIRGYADRIEAAKHHFREATKMISDYKNLLHLGNAAKMREAFLRILGTAEHLQTRFAIPKLASEEISELKQIAESALSAPPRNCDRFADELDAQIEFLNAVWLIYVTKDTMLEEDKFENWTEEMKSKYAKWLYAEAKGETK